MLRVLSMLALVLVLSSCQALPNLGAANTASSDRPKIVATNSIIADFVRNVAGDKVEIVTLVGPDSDPHTFEPTPSDNVALAGATLIFENGLGFEPWLDKLYTSSGSKATRVVVTEGLSTLPLAEDSHGHGEEHEDEHEDEHKDATSEKKDAHADEHEDGEADPHVWHNAKNAVHMVGMIRDALITTDAANAEVYRTNADRYQAELTALDAWIVEQVEALPKEQRKLVTTHDTFGHFAARYGFEVVGTALPTSTEAADPSAGEIAALVEKIKAAGVRTIFAENINDPRLMQQIASAAGVKVGPELYSDALGSPGSAGDTYVKMMRHNVSTIVASLKE